MRIEIKRHLKSYMKRARGKIAEHKLYKQNEVCQKLNQHPKAKGIFSTSLFGNLEEPSLYERYIKPLLVNAELVKELFPTWVLRIYVSRDFSEKLIEQFLSLDCEVYVMCQNSNGYSGTLWRFLPLAETKPFICIDSDMYLTAETAGVNLLKPEMERWLSSGKPYYKRRINLANLYIPLCAGMWGGNPKNGKPLMPNIKELISKYDTSEYGGDEAFLTREVWPEFKKHSYHTELNFSEIILFAVIITIVLILIYVGYRKIKKHW